MLKSKEVMQRDIFIVRKGTLFRDILKKWEENLIDTPVVDEQGKLIGLITPKQILKRVIPDYIFSMNVDNIKCFGDVPSFYSKLNEIVNYKVEDIMKKDVTWVYEDDSAFFAAIKLLSNDKFIRVIVVVDNDMIVKGIMTAFDITAAVLKKNIN